MAHSRWPDRTDELVSRPRSSKARSMRVNSSRIVVRPQHDCVGQCADSGTPQGAVRMLLAMRVGPIVMKRWLFTGRGLGCDEVVCPRRVDRMTAPHGWCSGRAPLLVWVECRRAVSFPGFAVVESLSARWDSVSVGVCVSLRRRSPRHGRVGLLRP